MTGTSGATGVGPGVVIERQPASAPRLGRAMQLAAITVTRSRGAAQFFRVFARDFSGVIGVHVVGFLL